MALYTRYDRDRRNFLEIHPSEDDEAECLTDLTANGLIVESPVGSVRDLFRTDEPDFGSYPAEHVRQYREQNAHVFSLWLTEKDGGTAVRFCDEENPFCEASIFGGLVVMPECFAADFVKSPERADALEWLNDHVRTALEAWLSNRIFDAHIHLVDRGIVAFRGPFFSPEEALEEATAEFPKLCYAEEDFEVIEIRRLKHRSG